MTSEPTLPAGFQLPEIDPAVRADPHEILSRLRTAAPQRWDAVFGGFFLTRYDDIRTVLTDRALLRDGEKAEEAATFAKMLQRPGPGLDSEGPPRVILFLDDPDHTRVRTPLVNALYGLV